MSNVNVPPTGKTAATPVPNSTVPVVPASASSGTVPPSSTVPVAPASTSTAAASTASTTSTGPITARNSALADLGTKPNPDFILDLQPWKIPDTGTPKKTRGRWCIRRYADADTEWKTSTTPNRTDQLPFGIISYAWGIYHNQALKQYGGFAGDVGIADCTATSTDELNNMAATNPMYYPTFDIGSSTITSENGPDLLGRSDKRAYTTPSGGKREIPTKEPLSWIFPVLRSKATPNDEASAPFTVNHIYKALKAMGTRFVWWDWACFPQGWDKDFWTNLDTTADYRVHNELLPQRANAFANLRYFYPSSTVGCLWWHQSIWDPSIQPKFLAEYSPSTTTTTGSTTLTTTGTTKPLKISDIPDGLIKVQDGPGNRDYNAVQRIINNFLDMVDRDPTKADPSKADTLTPASLIANATQGSVYQVINNLVSARAYEASLRSLWSMQEGVLFTSSRRPLLSIEQAKAQNTSQNPSVVLDRSGNDLKMWDTTKDAKLDATGKALSKIFTYGNVNLVDITYLTTQMAVTLADSLISRAYTPGDSRYWGGKTPAALPDYNTNFVTWCANKWNDGPARLLLSRLLNTGLVGYEYDSPLTLLEAKFGRNWEWYQSDMDVFINTVMGSLEIDFSAQLGIAKAAADAVGKFYKDDTTGRAGQVELELAKPNFLRALVDLYQWRFLLFARGDEFKSPAEAGFAMPFWDSLIGKERPAFAPLHVYLLGRDKELASVYGPNRWVDPTTKKTIPSQTLIADLPILSIPNLRVPAIKIGASPTYTFYEFPANFKGTGWSDAYLYQFVKPGGMMFEITPGATVETLTLPFNERMKLIPSTGDIALIPLKKGATVTGINKKKDIDDKKITNTYTPARPQGQQGATQTLPYPGSADWTTCVVLVKYQKVDLQTNPPPLNPKLTTAVFWGMGDFKDLEASEGGAKMLGDIHMY